MASTSPSNIWIPDSDTPMVLDTMFANLASSLENGIGARVKKLESFVGCSLMGTSTWLNSTLNQDVLNTNLGTTARGSFIAGLTLSNGVLTIVESGIYTVSTSVTMTRESAGTGGGRVAATIYVDGNPVSTASGQLDRANGNRLSVGTSLNLRLTAGQTVSLYTLTSLFPVYVTLGGETTLSCALTSRL